MGRLAAFSLALALSLGTSLRAGSGQDLDYASRIKPILSKNCTKCHGPDKHKGGLRLDVRSAAFQGGDTAADVIVAGKSKDSEMIRRVRSEDPDHRMPPKGDRLTPGEVALLARWIDAGAEWPADADPVATERKLTSEERAYWAFQPVRRPEVPDLAANPIDAFVLSRLKRNGIEPAPPASRSTLIRRVTYDLTGLPPTPEEIDAFLKDDSPGAYDRLIDRLLDSPRYGERWGQHWLDVVRFAESEGFEYDTPIDGLWRYRDYVIRSFNEDKPYDLFVREQLAGDEAAPRSNDHLIAAGFHRLGPVRRNAGNQEVASSRNEVLTDRTDIVGAAILGVTLGCARCHDHKFDPILQKDYYRLQAFMAATKQDDVPLVAKKRHEAWKAKTRSLEKKIEKLKERLEDPDTPDRDAIRKEITRLKEALPAPLPSINTVRNSETPTPIHVLKGGEFTRKGDPVGMRFLSVLVSENAVEMPLSTPRPRTVLARWLTDPAHPLTARVMANRIWQHHFGNGLVKTPNDFGRNGGRPSHPELLDYLADAFVEGGWRIKPLHRMILRSAAYRRSSSARPTGARAKDPDNTLLWRFDRRRLSAEEIRDSMLASSGRLNLKMGGRSIFLPVDVELVAALYKPKQWSVTADPGEHDRRSVYLVAKRNLRLPAMEVFDQPTLSASCGTRESSTHAPQALELLNGRISNDLAGAFADRLRRECGEDRGRQVDRAFRLATGRLPSAEERRLSLAFLEDEPLREFALALFNLNAFLYVP